MGAQYDNHFNKILAYLSSTGETDVLGPDTLAYSSSDNTLRLHDGCTRGGRYKLQLTARCVKEDGTLPPLTAVAVGVATLLPHGYGATTLTPQILGQVKYAFKADWPDYGGVIEVEGFLKEEEIENTKVEGAPLQNENIPRQLNEVLSQYAIQVRAVPDKLNGEGRVAIRGPKDIGPWSVEIL